MRLSIDVALDYWIDEPADIVLQIEAAAMPDQQLESQSLTVWTDTPIAAVPGEDGIGQRCLTRGFGQFKAQYQAIVAIDRPQLDIAALIGTPRHRLPGAVIGYLFPSRYCEADMFEGFVQSRFGALSGGALALALNDWVAGNIRYQGGTSTGTTTAMMTFASRHGVCRDYAHLLVALARAGGLPARCVAAYAPGVKPRDFHAVCEIWIDGSWHLFDATGMAGSADIARMVVGRDATDIAFMTVFGAALLNSQSVTVTAL